MEAASCLECMCTEQVRSDDRLNSTEERKQYIESDLCDTVEWAQCSF